MVQGHADLGVAADEAVEHRELRVGVGGLVVAEGVRAVGHDIEIIRGVGERGQIEVGPGALVGVGAVGIARRGKGEDSRGVGGEQRAPQLHHEQGEARARRGLLGRVLGGVALHVDEQAVRAAGRQRRRDPRVGGGVVQVAAAVEPPVHELLVAEVVQQPRAVAVGAADQRRLVAEAVDIHNRGDGPPLPVAPHTPVHLAERRRDHLALGQRRRGQRPRAVVGGGRQRGQGRGDEGQHVGWGMGCGGLQQRGCMARAARAKICCKQTRNKQIIVQRY